MKDQSGSILVLTAITVAVLMAIGVGFVSSTTVEYIANANNSRHLQTFYLAEAGLSWGLDRLEAYLDGQVLPGASDVSFPVGQELSDLLNTADLIALDSSFAAVSIELVSPDAHRGKLISTAITNGVRSSVTQDIEVFVEYTGGGHVAIVPTAFPKAILSKGNVNAGSSNVSVTPADSIVIVNGSLTGHASFRSSHAASSDESGEFDKVMEAIPDSASLIRELHPDSVPLPAGNVLDTGSDPDATVYYHSANIPRNFTLSGVGKAYIHLTNSSISLNNRSINFGGDPNRLTLYIQGTSVSLGNANAKVAAVLWTPTASISISSNSQFRGSIVSGGSSVTLGSGSSAYAFILAPFAQVSLRSGSVSTGGLVADSVNLQSGARLVYSPSGGSVGYYVGFVEDEKGSSGSQSVSSVSLIRGAWSNR